MLEAGIFLADRYEIIEKIGAGGMSDVYKAKDHVLGRDVAIKVLKSEFAEDMTFVSKFRTEAQSAAGLEHPNIVNIYDVGSEDGMYFIVMEYVEGITLKTYIEKKGQLNYKEVISIAIQVGRGIEAAHKKNIIHRDIKPQNIIISKEGKVKVTDFGIARAASGNTINADVMGSVHYSSPEQARNGYVTEQSDIYSLGIVMYEMATGRVPYDGETAVAVAIQHLQGEMESPRHFAPELPVSMENIIRKATMKSPDRRYESMEDLLIDLKKALISPEEDFVSISGGEDNGKTRVITEAEIDQIRRETEYDDDYDGEYEDEEYDEYEEDDENKMDKIVSIMGIAAAVIIAIIVIYLIGSFFGLFKFSKSDKKEDTQTEETVEAEKTIEVPNLLGKTEAEAKEELEKLGLGIKNIGTASSDEYAEDLIMSQSVSAGEKVEKNTTIKVTLSSGKGEVSIPDVVGMTEASAINMLKDAGFKYSTEYAVSDSVQQGQVISQNPAGKSYGKEGDTITLFVSSGKETVEVPDVTGKTESDALYLMQVAGLNTNLSRENSDSVAEGVVISQSVEAKRQIEKGTTINIVVSQGPKTVYYHYTAKISDFIGSVSTAKDISYKLTANDGSNTVISSGSGATLSTTFNANNITASGGHLHIDYKYEEKTTVNVDAVVDSEGNVTTPATTREDTVVKDGSYDTDVSFTPQ
ncbi:MAG: Stk1 family PASTA domain-containing Ser/Thr kinase [Lachnospiraceae bacterium]|nr:Stk1 family PASTA domain-containing Ser/Thr kinase [Lachnospiraceae bacterium]